jgi:hypothetical protein
MSGRKSSHIWSVPWCEDIADYSLVVSGGVFDTVEHGWDYMYVSSIFSRVRTVRLFIEYASAKDLGSLTLGFRYLYSNA